MGLFYKIAVVKPEYTLFLDTKFQSYMWMC